MTDSSAWLIDDELSPGNRARLMNALFGASGIHLNFVRVPIGGSDITANGCPTAMTTWRRARSIRPCALLDRARPRLRSADARADAVAQPSLEILAKPWSPPAWMKTNGSFDNPHGTGMAARIYRGRSRSTS